MLFMLLVFFAGNEKMLRIKGSVMLDMFLLVCRLCVCVWGGGAGVCVCVWVWVSVYMNV